MALLERCKVLREHIAAHEHLRRADEEAEGVRESASAIQGLADDLAAALGRSEVLRLKGVAILKAPDPAGATAALQHYRTALADSSKDSGRDCTRLKRAIEKLTRDVTAVVEKALGSIERELPAIEETFLKQVELIPAYSLQVARIREERDALLGSSEPAGMSPEELSVFMDRRDQLRQLADQLDPAEFPKEVLAFFKAARHVGGAPLTKLTDTVREWLQERDALKNVHVIVVGP